MHTAYLLTGTNLGERKKNLADAAALIAAQCGQLTRLSSIYETAAWGKTDQPAFLNQSMELKTMLNARQLIRHLLKIEKKMGRIREEKYGPRLIDIDILLFNNEVHDYEFLRLPHPELPNRRFALLPLAEIAPDQIHPLLHLTVSGMLANCTDNLDVTIVS